MCNKIKKHHIERSCVSFPLRFCYCSLCASLFAANKTRQLCVCVCASRRCCYLAALGAIVMFYRHYYFLGPFNINRISRPGWPLFPRARQRRRRRAEISAANETRTVAQRRSLAARRLRASLSRARNCWLTEQVLKAATFGTEFCANASRGRSHTTLFSTAQHIFVVFCTQRASVTNGCCVCVECLYNFGIFKRKTSL